MSVTQESGERNTIEECGSQRRHAKKNQLLIPSNCQLSRFNCRQRPPFSLYPINRLHNYLIVHSRCLRFFLTIYPTFAADLSNDSRQRLRGACRFVFAHRFSISAIFIFVVFLPLAVQFDRGYHSFEDLSLTCSLASQSPMTAAAVACLLLSSPLTIFSMESSSLAAAAVGDEGEVDDLFGEDERGGDDGAALEATLSNADPPDVPIDAEVGDKRGENLCRSLSAARGDGVVPAPYAEARSGFCEVHIVTVVATCN